MIQTPLHILTCDSNEQAAEMAAESMTRCLREHFAEPILLLLSGGSALEVIQKLPVLGDMRHITVTVLDERFDPSGACGNFARIAETEWFALAQASGMQALETTTHTEDTRASVAKRFEEGLATWQHAYPQGIRIALFGMGGDGHTAGIFPDDDQHQFDDRFNGQRMVADYYAPQAVCVQERITTTCTFLRTIDYGFAYVCGVEKRPLLQRLVNDQSWLLHRFPALIWKDVAAMQVVTDSTV
jgi:6-phosphogluconolactonase